MAYRPPINLKPLRQLVNPRAYARGAVAEYDPRINALMRQMTQGQADNTTALNNIHDWYGQLTGDNQKAQGENQAYLDKMMGSGDTFRQNLIQSLGAGVAPALSAAASHDHDFLASLGVNENNFLTNQRGADALQGVEAGTQQQRNYDAFNKDLLGQLTDERGAKAAAYAKAYQEGIGLKHDQAKDYIDAQMTTALAGPELEQAQLANRGTRLNQQAQRQQLQQAKELFPGQKRAQQLANQGQQWEIDHAQNPKTGQTYGWQDLKPADLLGVQKTLQSQVLDETGNLKVGPIQAYNAMGNQLRAMSHGKWNPAVDQKVRQFRDAVLQQYLPAWNKKHPGKAYVFQNGRLVPKR